MAVTIRIPALLRALVGDKSEVSVESGAVGEVLARLVSEYPDVKDRLYDEDGNLRRFVNVYVNGEDIRALDGEATQLKDGDEVAIVPAIAGGICPLLAPLAGGDGPRARRRPHPVPARGASPAALDRAPRAGRDVRRQPAGGAGGSLRPSGRPGRRRDQPLPGAQRGPRAHGRSEEHT